jgi:cobalt/nickel transport system ATP-binding protein
VNKNGWDVEIENLSYTYPDGNHGLSGVGLRILSGESVAILDPNGAGKSTLLLALPGLIFGTGSITIGGIRLTQQSVRDVRKRVGILF